MTPLQVVHRAIRAAHAALKRSEYIAQYGQDLSALEQAEAKLQPLARTWGKDSHAAH